MSIHHRMPLARAIRSCHPKGALLLAGCLLCGCAAQAASTPPSQAPSRAALAILLTSDSAAMREAGLANAVQALIQRCMRARQLPNQPAPESAASLAAGSVPLPEFPAYGGLAPRRTQGYGLYAGLVARASRAYQAGGGTGAVDRQHGSAGPLPPAARARYSMAEFGPASSVVAVALPGGARAQVQDGGCRGAAARRIYGSVASYTLAVEGAPLLTDELIGKVEANPGFVAAVRAWSRCMAGRGFRYASPTSAYHGLSLEYQAAGPTSGLRHREIAVATADYQCAKQTRLLRVTAALQRTEAARLGAAAEAQLRQITRIDAEAAQRAGHIAT